MAKWSRWRSSGAWKCVFSRPAFRFRGDWWGRRMGKQSEVFVFRRFGKKNSSTSDENLRNRVNVDPQFLQSLPLPVSSRSAFLSQRKGTAPKGVSHACRAPTSRSRKPAPDFRKKTTIVTSPPSLLAGFSLTTRKRVRTRNHPSVVLSPRLEGGPT